MKVAVVSAGFEPRNLRLQPHRSLLEMGRQLAARGHRAILVSNGAERLPDRDEIMGLPVCRLPSVNMFHRHSNAALIALLAGEQPDVVLWHVSLSSFLHQDLHHCLADRTIGVVTSPVYGSLDVLRLGLSKLSTNPEMIATHLTGTVVPGALIRRAFTPGGPRGLITLSQTTRRHLLAKGAPADRVWVVPPGVDAAWLDNCITAEERQSVRGQLGYGNGEFIVIYFGSPAPVRGLHTTLLAVEKAAKVYPHIRLVILSRRHSDEWQKTAAQLERLINRDGLRGRVQVVDGFLQPPQLIAYIAASDLVCLPFELVPSDVPLSILEAMALRQPVIGTRIACIPEMLGEDRGFLVPPGSPHSLAAQIEAIAAGPSVAAERGQHPRTYVEARGTWSQMGQTLEEVLAHAGLMR